MKYDPTPSIRIAKPLEFDYYRISGRIRDENNHSVMGCIVQAFDKDPSIYLHQDDMLGEAKTDEYGAFEISFDKDAFEDWFETGPEVYLIVKGQDGKFLIRTPEKENITKKMDFQIKLGKNVANPLEPNLYANNFPRMISAFNTLFSLESLSGSDASTVVEVLFRAINSWVLYRDDLARYAGYDGIQVPLRPRREKHNHVTRWDKPVLPIGDHMLQTP